MAVETKGQHIVPSGNRWAVRKSGALKASGIYRTQEEAITKGRKIAERQRTELYIHGRDGRIRERNTYSEDPFPPKG